MKSFIFDNECLLKVRFFLNKRGHPWTYYSLRGKECSPFNIWFVGTEKKSRHLYPIPNLAHKLCQDHPSMGKTCYQMKYEGLCQTAYHRMKYMCAKTCDLCGKSKCLFTWLHESDWLKCQYYSKFQNSLLRHESFILITKFRIFRQSLLKILTINF